MKDIEVQNDIEVNRPSVPEMVTVYAKANFSQCTREALSSNDLKALEGIYYRSDHLRRNFRSVECGSYRSHRSESEGLLDHVLDIKFTVDTSRLWENARSYTWKHLGQYEWKLNDGTIVTFNRIHVK